ncbi:uncharacterized protein LOC113351780 [Papaver somniferum]|uniref:uncharacterized protein LOC113351780 n=1 Tax=Papaver somniferum TaxID=3469 RepID=UPI000E70064C|nr:uncharacterized protein LOC113351780 [Papaver somniferum]
MKNRLHRWNDKLVNQSGRTTLVKHVLNAIQVHQMSTFKFPDKSIEELERVQRQFWLNKTTRNGIVITAWRNLCRDKDSGGLGFRDLKSFNIALLARSSWRLCKQESQLWAKDLKVKHFPNTSLLHAHEKKNATWAWKRLYIIIAFFIDCSFWQVGNGKKIHIWLDKWATGVEEQVTLTADTNLNIQDFNLVSDLID